MLKLQCEGTIKLMERRDSWIDYDDKSKGKVTGYNYYVQCPNEKDELEILQFRSDKELSKLVDHESILTFGFYSFQKGESKMAGIKLLDAVAIKA